MSKQSKVSVQRRAEIERLKQGLALGQKHIEALRHHINSEQNHEMRSELEVRLGLFEARQKYYQYCLEQHLQDPHKQVSKNPNSLFNQCSLHDFGFMAKYVPNKKGKLQ